jgi:hypothetical protein
MEEILSQRFNYAQIVPYRNYCRLDEKNPQFNGTTFNSDLDDLDLDLDSTDITDKKISGHNWGRFSIETQRIGRIMSLPQKRGNRKTCFFYDGSDITENFQLNYVFKKGTHNFDTTKDQQIKRHYGNPFSSINVNTMERSIRRHGDKVTIKIYNQTKNRGFNSKFFKKSFSVHSLTINTVTGNVTALSMSNSAKRKIQSFRTNSFGSINEILKNIGLIDSRGGYIDKTSRVYPEYLKMFDTDIFLKTIYETLELPGDDIEDIEESLIQKFVEKKKIKVSNNYRYWIENFYPTEKFLKKNDRKLIASILDMFKIKSKVTIKIMHENNFVDIFSLAELCYFLGDNFSKYVGNINTNLFSNNSPEEGVYPASYKSTFHVGKKDNFEISDVEKENIVKIINESNMRINPKFIGELNDHFNMIKKLRHYSPDLRMNARTQMEFHHEHLELSKMMSFIKKGWVIEYKFSDKMVDAIEKPVTVQIDLTEYDKDNQPIGPVKSDNITFYPYILKREEEYDEEGRTMHHCVASYSDKDRSIIVSLRTKDLSDRVTCEFDCQTGNMIQARHFCNKRPPGDMELAISELQDRAKYYARIGLLHSLEKKKVPVKINGIEIIPEVKEPRRFQDEFNLFI